MGLGGFLARLTAILLVLAILAACAGFLLPRERSIDSKTVVLAPPEQVFDFITDVKGYERWRDDASNIAVAEGSNPPGWSETASGWSMNFREVKRERPTRFEVEFDSPSGFQGRRTYVLEPTEAGDRTILTRTDVFEIGNPLRRVYSYVALNLQRTINAQMEDLGREFLPDSLEADPSDSAEPAAEGLSPADLLPTGTARRDSTSSGTATGGTTPTAGGSATRPADVPTGAGPTGAGPTGAGPKGTAQMGTAPVSITPAVPRSTPSPSASPSPTASRI